MEATTKINVTLTEHVLCTKNCVPTVKWEATRLGSV